MKRKHNVQAMRAFDPSRLIIHTGCRTPQEADELLAPAARWTRAKRV